MEDPQEYLLYNENNNNNIEEYNPEDAPYDSEKLSAIFVLIIALILMGMNILSLYYSYDYLLYASRKYPFETFDRCIKYQSFTEIYFTLFAFMAAISAVLMSVGITIGYDLFFEKFLITFMNFNYYVFGLLLFASSVLGLINYDKICFDCYKNNPNDLEFNLSTMICLVLIAFIGGIVTYIFSSINAHEYVSNCIRYNKDGNFILGKLFWNYVLKWKMNSNNNSHERNE